MPGRGNHRAWSTAGERANGAGGSHRHGARPGRRAGPWTRCQATAIWVLVAVLLAGARCQARESVPVRYALVVIHLRNVTDSGASRVGVRIPVPLTNEYQQVLGVQFAPQPTRHEPIPEGGKLAFFEIPYIGPRQVEWVWMLVRCRLLAFQPSQVHTPRFLPQDVRRRCLQPSRLVDSQAPMIQGAAQEIAAGATGAYDLARRINRFMASQFTYEMDSQQTDATTVLTLRRGSCSELARMYVALARAAGLPARLARGSRLRADLNGYVDCVHHCWVEVYLDNYGWFPVDPRINCSSLDPEERFGKLPAQYLTFMRIPGQQEDTRFSAELSMVENSEAVRDRVRTYWFDPSAHPLWEMMERLGPGDRPGQDPNEVRHQLLALHGTLAVPFLSMALYEPLAAGSPGSAVRALKETAEPAAVVPLLDFLETTSPSDSSTAALDALKALTGVEFSTATEWRSWLWADGREYLRGTSQDPHTTK